ncbi:MAG: hypothetical protein ACXWPP_20350, partial [Ktedonobacteraceae bacterium]
LGQRVLNDLATRYPQFKPKYIDQVREYEGAPFDMLVASIMSPEDTIVTIMDDSGEPLPQEYHKDIANVIYIIADDVLRFGMMHTYYDIVTRQEPEIRPDLREFYETYQKLKQTLPDIVSLIERFAMVYEIKAAEYNGTYEPLATRELLWNFAQALIGAVPGQNN